MDGVWKVTIWPLTGEKGYLLLRQSWNFCHVIAKKKECVQDSCTCIQNGPKCTNLCKLTSCANQPPEDDDDTTDLYNDSDDSDVTVMMMMMRAMTLKQKTLINVDMHKLLA